MALFPATQGPLSKTSRSRKEPETMSGYPTPESIRAKEPKVPVNYPPPVPPKSARKSQAPPSNTRDKAPTLPIRQTVSIEDDSEIDMNGPTEFRYAPAPAFHGREERDQPPLRSRAGSRAPVDTAGGREGREDDSGQSRRRASSRAPMNLTDRREGREDESGHESDVEQAIRQLHKK